MSSTKVSAFFPVAVAATLFAGASLCAAAEAPQATSGMAGECAGCHLSAPPRTLWGRFDNVAFKSKTIQLKIDDRVELVKFDEDEVKMITSQGKTGVGVYLHQTKKGQELKIEYSEERGVKTALKIMEKPPVKVSADAIVSTSELEKLLQQPKGSVYLYDARPLSRFREGAIPGAVSLPYSAFAASVGKLPADKGALVVFYCGGPTCSLSPAAAAKAKALGYKNVKVYREGLPGWAAKHYTVLTPQDLKEQWLDQGNPFVLLDLRPAKQAAKGHLPGAVSFPVNRIAKLIGDLPDADRKPPMVLYDAKDGKDAQKAAQALIKAGYGDVKLVTGGFAAWKGAKYHLAAGKFAKASYTPKPRTGEIAVAQFEKYAASLPADVMIIDVRNPDEVKGGMVKSAKNIPQEQLAARLAEIPKEKTIITQCTTGVRAEMAYHALKALGYSKVAFLNATVAFEKDGSYTITAK